MSTAGGAIVLSPEEKVTENVSKVYAGRASSAPVVDLFITLLSMGLNGYKEILEQRNAMLPDFKAQFREVAEKHGEVLIECPTNTISYGITLDQLVRSKHHDESVDDYLKAVNGNISYFGAMLFSRCVSGTRVVPRAQTKVVSGQEFVGFGSSTECYPHAYMTAACAIGLSKSETEEFFARLDKTMKEFKRKSKK
jgi:O-phospho-L-seryl-tRNASec:L-selenocysteinyl-tRNA synthase